MAVFVSYRRTDKEVVQGVVSLLRGCGIEVWFDESELEPGAKWMPKLQQALLKCTGAVVFIGPGGLEKSWQADEVEVLLEQQRSRDIRVIPVLLPGLSDEQAAELVPPFLRQNTWVRFDPSFKESGGLDRLIWGITGVRPAPPEVGNGPPPPPSDPIDKALDDLAGVLTSDSITFFVGRSFSWDAAGQLPGSSDITRRLLNSLHLLKAEEPGPPLPVELAAVYYAVKHDELMLEGEVSRLIVSCSASIPPEHRALATLLGLLRTLPVPRGRRRQKLLVVTTCLDVCLERALLAGGVPFTRLVQYSAQPRIDVGEFRDVVLTSDGRVQLTAGGSSLSTRADDLTGLDDAIFTHPVRPVALDSAVSKTGNALKDLSLEDLAEPIVYKLLGSHDVQLSCTISADQQFDFAHRVLQKDTIPDQVNSVLTTTPLLLLGCRILAPDFRLAYHTLLRDQLTSNPRRHYAVQQPPAGISRDFDEQAQYRLWDDIKDAALKRYKVKILEAGPLEFLRRLKERLTGM